MTPGNELAGKVAMVTGGSGAIGGAICEKLGEAGAVAVSLDLVAPARRSIPFVSCDVRDDASVSAAVEKVYREYGNLHLVIHSAGVSRDAVVWKLTPNDWDLVQSVNFGGAFLMLRHTAPAMRAAGG